MFKDKQLWLKKILPAMGAGVLVAIILVGGISLWRSYRRVVVVANKAVEPTGIVPPTATPTPDPDRDFSVLLLGYAGGEHDGAGLTDSMILVTIQPKRKRVVLTSIPRDLWVRLPLSQDDSEEHWYKVNAAYVLGKDDKKFNNKAVEFTGPAGGGELVKSVVSDITGIDIDYFLAVDFTGFMGAIDKLGGIKVYVPVAFSDPWFPIEGKEDDICEKSPEDLEAITATLSGGKLEEEFTCRYEELSFERGLVEMDGETALKFARSRHSDVYGGDFGRSDRQRLVIEAVKSKIMSIGFLPKVIPLLNQLSWHVQTDVDLGQMKKWIDRADEFLDYEIISTALTEKNVLMQSRSEAGQFILTSIDGQGVWMSIQNYMEELLTETAPESGKIE